MSGKAAGGESSGKSQSRSAKAGPKFPVGRIHRLLKRATMLNVRVPVRRTLYLFVEVPLTYPSVHLAAVIESAGNTARDSKKHSILPSQL
jgi:histone H2A